ncbi:hypothetical protein PSACC_00650 [Paramicrosporidium saccamoebae]|uniref:UBR-type domain-containing protein n=1 Tax=Paramicrosporidium saccamoebae TaxID=1246581 RepID=A0A2H9TP43_9FUNG|nr:hypothetical protein PSACC_00650 [Paramicrosporidium saccamoebae]
MVGEASSEKIITLQEYLEEEAELEKEAAEAFPGKFDECTFGHGYIRQPLYACRTCVKDGEARAAICYSCSVVCHPKCELIELSARRHFRCDCGNPLFSSACGLQKKDELNEENQYDGKAGQNFFGRFCSCNVFFDATVEQSDMLQCLVCEDWYHEDCIGKTPPVEAFDSMICAGCVVEKSFLEALCQSKHVIRASEYKDVDIETEEDGQRSPKQAKLMQPKCETKMYASNYVGCFAVKVPTQQESIFLADGWKADLCQCEACKEMTTKAKLDYLYTSDDIHVPEPDDEATLPSYRVGQMLLEKHVNRQVAIDGIKAVENLRHKLLDFLKPFEEGNKVVTKEDIELFFGESKLGESRLQE